MKKLILPSLVGTGAMTLFSYLVSIAEGKNFKEPELLARLLKKAGADLNKQQLLMAGAGAHYLVGLMFVTVYIYLWEHTVTEPGLITGIGLGAASGLCGIAAWELTLKFFPDPPVKNRRRFFGHLFLAHIIFAVSASLIYANRRK